MKSNRGLVPLMTIVIILFGFTVSAQNMVANGDFDLNVLGWVPFMITYEWDAEDYQQSPTSGSLKTTNDGDWISNWGISTCIDGLVAGQSYDFGGWLWIPPGQIGHGSVSFALYCYDGAGCTGTTATLVGTTPMLQAADDWAPLDRFGVVAPANTQSARLVAISTKFSTGTDPLVVHYDGVKMGIYGGVFADGFEDGTASIWTSTTGHR